MEPIRVVLVDDNEDAIEIIRFFISGFPAFEVVAECRNGEELIEKVMVQKPDLVLADINMPKKDGIDAVKDCLSFQPGLKFIFITGYDDHAIAAFQMSAVDYIVKPVEKERLQIALEKAEKVIRFEQGSIDLYTREKSIKNLVIKDLQCTRYIPVDEIYFIEKSGKKCFIHTADEIYETTETLGKLYERLLDAAFYSAHRSFIINLDKISHITPQHETYIAYFHGYEHRASISKLKINDIRERIALLH